MAQSTYDPCLLYTHKNGFGIIGLQTDDTLVAADELFACNEDKELKKAKFLAKEREQLTDTNPLKFNGGLISLVNGTIQLTQEHQCSNLKLVSTKQPTDLVSSREEIRKAVVPKDQYVSQRARGAYIATVCQPEATFDLSFAAQTTNPREDDVKALNTRLQWQINNKAKGLSFVELDAESLRLVVFTDASFANNFDFSS
jgi:hypothetical protein